MIRSQLCDILGIEKPIFQGGMAWIADANLAAAVSNAGGQRRNGGRAGRDPQGPYAHG